MAEGLSLDELEARGLYDPEAPDAEPRRAMFRYLLDEGADIDELAEVWNEYGWHGLTTYAVEVAARLPGLALTFEEAMASRRLDPDRVVRLWRAFGFPDPRSVTRPFTEREVELLEGTLLLADIVGEQGMMQMARVIGSAMARVAEAGATAFRLGSEIPRVAAGGQMLDVAAENAGIVRNLLPAAAEVFDMVHRRHVFAASYRQWEVAEGGSATVTEATVGFADLVGYTATTAQLSASELAEIVEGFEERIAELVADRGGRLVKLIGDEAMFVFSEAAGAIELGSDLLRAFGATLRAGMAAGSVATLRGDYYGDVVNLASRLTSVAEPGTVLVPASLAEAAPDDVALVDAGSFELKGFAAPVPAFVLRRE